MAVNESALLSTAATAGDVYEATWLRDRKRFLQLKDKNIKYYVDKSQCRCKLFLNGTLQIERVVKEDSGKYTVTVYQQDGKLKAEQDMMLIVLGEFLLFPYHSQLNKSWYSGCLLHPLLIIAHLSVLRTSLRRMSFLPPLSADCCFSPFSCSCCCPLVPCFFLASLSISHQFSTCSQANSCEHIHVGSRVSTAGCTAAPHLVLGPLQPLARAAPCKWGYTCKWGILLLDTACGNEVTYVRYTCG